MGHLMSSKYSNQTSVALAFERLLITSLLFSFPLIPIRTEGWLQQLCWCGGRDECKSNPSPPPLSYAMLNSVDQSSLPGGHL